MTLTIYSTTWCGPCRRLKAQLDDAGIRYEVVDVDEHPEFGRKIEAATGGNRTVPSVQVGSDLLVNPTVQQIKDALGGVTAT